MSGGALKIKLSKNMRPYIGRVVRNGRVQRAFAAQIGRPVGACMRSSATRPVTKRAKECSKQFAGSHLNI